MSRSTNAVLLSALVLPGAGHLYLKHYARGAVLIVISLACLGIIVDRVMQQAAGVLDMLASEGGAAGADQLAEVLNQASTSQGSSLVSLATLVLAGCWLAGIVDAYRLARRSGG